MADSPTRTPKSPPRGSARQPGRRPAQGRPSAPGRRRPPRRRRRRPFWQDPRTFKVLIPLLAVVVLGGIVANLLGLGQMAKLRLDLVPGWVDKQIVEINGVGRRGEKLQGVKDIAIHYVGNPGSTAQQNHDFYDQPETEVSSHFIVGLEGEVIQCVPLYEKSSATNERNSDTISIEVCHPDATGQFNQATYDSLVKLTAWLCDTAGIGRDRVIRHYDVTGKLCPLYFVDHPEAWEQFLSDVKAA